MKPGLWSRLAHPFALIAESLTKTLRPSVLGVRRLEIEETDAPLTGQRLWLDLPKDRVLLRSIALSAGQETQWREHVAERLPLLSPWKSGEYLWDAAITGQDKAGGLTVQVALAALAELQSVERRLGRSLDGIRLRATSDRPVLWLREDVALKARLQAIIAGVVVGVTLFGLALAGWQMQGALRNGQVAEADRAATARLQAAADRPMGLAEAAMALLDRRPPEASRALTLARLAQRLPDGAWAMGLRIDDAGFELSGISAQPEALVPLLEADPGLEQVQLSATSAREAESSLFTFAISGRTTAAGDWP